MRVFVNNKEVETTAINLFQLMCELAIPEKGVAVAVAGQVIPRSQWEFIILSEGVSIVVVKGVCGG